MHYALKTVLLNQDIKKLWLCLQNFHHLKSIHIWVLTDFDDEKTNYLGTFFNSALIWYLYMYNMPQSCMVKHI